MFHEMSKSRPISALKIEAISSTKMAKCKPIFDPEERSSTYSLTLKIEAVHPSEMSVN
jgi:hypothetical protein